MGLLRAGSDWYDVRVIRVQSVEAAMADAEPSEEDVGKTCREEFTTLFAHAAKADAEDSSEESAAELPPTAYRIGLYRVSDTFDPDIKPSYCSWAGLFCHLRHVNPNSWGIIALGIMLLLMVVMVPIVSLYYVFSDSAGPVPQKRSRWSESKVAAENSLIESFAASAAKALADESNSAKGTPLSTKIDEKLDDLRQTVRRLPGALPFALPDVVQRLQLTESQQKRVQEILDAAADMIKGLAGSSTANNDSAVKKIMSETRNSVLDLLDSDQKKKWSEIAGESDNKGK